MQKYLLLGLSIFLFNCTSVTKKDLETATSIPPERHLAFKEKTGVYNSKVTVIRQKNFFGGGCYYAIKIDDTLAARLDIGEKAEFWLKEGNRVFISARDPQGFFLCRVGGNEDFENVQVTPVKESCLAMTIGWIGASQINYCIDQ